MGMKSRGVYETPGGTILLTAHRGIESICLDRGEMHLKARTLGRIAWRSVRSIVASTSCGPRSILHTKSSISAAEKSPLGHCSARRCIGWRVADSCTDALGQHLLAG